MSKDILGHLNFETQAATATAITKRKVKGKGTV